MKNAAQEEIVEASEDAKQESSQLEVESEDDEDDLKEEEKFKGALKITKIKNRRYIRMPNFPKRAVHLLKQWLNDHLDNPYPSYKEKETLSKESGLTKRQIQNWFTNARKVYLPSFIINIENLATPS